MLLNTELPHKIVDKDDILNLPLENVSELSRITEKKVHCFYSVLFKSFLAVQNTYKEPLIFCIKSKNLCILNVTCQLIQQLYFQGALIDF